MSYSTLSPTNEITYKPLTDCFWSNLLLKHFPLFFDDSFFFLNSFPTSSTPQEFFSSSVFFLVFLFTVFTLFILSRRYWMIQECNGLGDWSLYCWLFYFCMLIHCQTNKHIRNRIDRKEAIYAPELAWQFNRIILVLFFLLFTFLLSGFFCHSK